MFFTFSHPQIRILVRHGKKRAGTNVISLSFHTLFFPFFPTHKSKFRRILVKNGIGPPLALFVYIFSYLVIQISKRFGKRWSWTPTEPAAYPFVTACVFGHSIRQRDLMELGSGSKRYVANICCPKLLDHSNRHAH